MDGIRNILVYDIEYIIYIFTYEGVVSMVYIAYCL